MGIALHFQKMWFCLQTFLRCSFELWPLRLVQPEALCCCIIQQLSGSADHVLRRSMVITGHATSLQTWPATLSLDQRLVFIGHLEFPEAPGALWGLGGDGVFEGKCKLISPPLLVKSPPDVFSGRRCLSPPVLIVSPSNLSACIFVVWWSFILKQHMEQKNA